MNKEPQKRNQSSMQVIKTLRVLLEGNYTMSELIEKLNSNENDAVFNNSVVSKYINTCRYCGIDIPKIHNKYYIVSIPFGIHFNDFECELLNRLKKNVEYNMSNKALNYFNDFISRISKFTSKKIARLEKNSQTDFLELFEQAVANRKKVKLFFRNNFNLEGIPLQIKSDKNKVFVQIFDSKHERSIDIARLSGIEILKDTFVRDFNIENIVYVLKDKLAQRYELKPDEKLLSKNPDGSISISTSCTNTDELFSRLLRYDNMCEVISPQSARTEMKQLIDDTLKNYGI